MDPVRPRISRRSAHMRPFTGTGHETLLGLLEDDRGSASTYVGDLLSTYAGTDEEQEDAICLTVAGLLTLGFDLDFDKAQDSRNGSKSCRLMSGSSSDHNLDSA